MKAISKLVSIGSEALTAADWRYLGSCSWTSQLQAELLAMLRLRNGFYAFEGALHVLPVGRQATVMSLKEWNSVDLWRYEYGDLAEGLTFFAEDAFGNQFCLREGEVFSFDAETGQTDLVGLSIEDWASRLLFDYEFLTGFPLLHDWQVIHGPVPAGSRLLPVVPFVLGGEYSLANLRLAGAVSGMRSRGNLARQICDLPDGAQVRFEITE